MGETSVPACAPVLYAIGETRWSHIAYGYVHETEIVKSLLRHSVRMMIQGRLPRKDAYQRCRVYFEVSEKDSELIRRQ